MLKSMTGFGTGRARAGEEEISVEVRAVNHKHLEVKVRTPRELSALEPLVLKAVRARCARGAVDVAVRRSSGTASGAVPTVDAAMARAWREALRSVSRAVELPDAPNAAQIANQPGVVRMEEPVTDLAVAEGALEHALAEALDALVAGASRIMRELSSGQYDLTHDKGEFFVVDHADASLRRGVRTLSGGETFQASLALALALSEQLAGLSTASASLESIMLDEGFGTLDASTLDTVAATLENLAARGDRMVGVVTHVPALAERIPVRFEVTKDARGVARVERSG